MNIYRSEQFESLRQIAHQKFSIYVSPNSIVRFQAFWIENNFRKGPIPDGHDITSEAVDDQSSLLRAYERIETKRYREFKEELQEKIEAFLPEAKGYSHDSEKDRYWFMSGRATDGDYHRFILEEENQRFYLTHVIDTYYERRNGPNRRFNETTVSKLKRIFNELAQNYLEYQENIDSTTEIQKFWSAKQWNKMHQNFSYMHRDIWQEVDQSIFNWESFPCPPRILKDKYDKSEDELAAKNQFSEALDEILLEEGEDKSKQIGMRMFADLRGIVLPARPVDELPSYREGENYDREKYNKELTDNEALVKQNWLFIKAANYSSYKGDISSTKELIISEFKKGIGLYASALGQPDFRDNGNEAMFLKADRPISYVMFAKTSEYKQLGRFMERLHRLADQRLLALRDAEKILKCGKEIEEVGVLLDAAETLQALEEKKETHRITFDTVENIHRRIGQIGSHLEKGFAFRISESRRHAETLDKLIDKSEFSEVLGFASYPEFAEKYTKVVLRNIDELGQQLSRLRLRADTLQDRLQVSSIREAHERTNAVLVLGAVIEIFIAPFYFTEIYDSTGWVGNGENESGLFARLVEAWTPFEGSTAYFFTYLHWVVIMACFEWGRRHWTNPEKRARAVFPFFIVVSVFSFPFLSTFWL